MSISNAEWLPDQGLKKATKNFAVHRLQWRSVKTEASDDEDQPETSEASAAGHRFTIVAGTPLACWYYTVKKLDEDDDELDEVGMCGARECAEHCCELVLHGITRG